jgi:hypothetical protein
MAAGTKVQLRLGGRVVAEVTFHDGELRIGEHVLTISAEAEEDALVARAGESDAWDVARAFFAPELAPRSRAASIADIGEILFANADRGDAALAAEAAEEGAADAAPVGAAPHAVRRPASSLDLPDPEGRFAIREEDLVGGQRPDASLPLTSVELAGETTLFDFAASNDLGFSEPSLTRTLVRGKEPPGQVVRSTAAASSAGSAGHPTALHSAPFASMPERDLVTEGDDEDHFWDLEKELEIASGPARMTAGGPLRSASTDLVVEVVLGSEGLAPQLRAVLRELGAQEQRLPAELRIRRR